MLTILVFRVVTPCSPVAGIQNSEYSAASFCVVGVSRVSTQCAVQAGYKEDGQPERRDGNARDSEVIAVS